MPDTAPPKKSGTIGGVKKEYVYAGGAVLGVVAIVVYTRSKNSAANSAASVTDPAGNVCTTLSPTSGYCPGSAEDLAYAGTGATLGGSDSASYVGGQVIGYDQYGNPIYSTSTDQTGVPGSYTNNAQWSQAAVTYLQQTDSNVDSSVISAALGAYITGNPVTAAQQSIIQQAIAFEGYPPVGGTGGYPPSMKTAPVTKPPVTNRPTSITATGTDSGDINQIAKKYGLTEAQLVAANPSLKTMKIKIGGKSVLLYGSGAPVPKGTVIKIPPLPKK